MAKKITKKAGSILSHQHKGASMSTALLIIDVQQSLVDEGIWESERILERLNQLIAMARSDDIPVVLVRDTRVEPDGRFHGSLDRQTHDIEIVKSFCNSFMETDLDEVLQSKRDANFVVLDPFTDWLYFFKRKL